MYSNVNGPLGPAAATGIVGGGIGWEVFQTQPNNLWLWLFLIAATFTLIAAIGAAREILPSTYGLRQSFVRRTFREKPLAPAYPARKRYLHRR